MNPPRSTFGGRFIVVADEDRAIAGLVIETLLDDGHAVFQAYDGLSAFELALGLKVCDLVISNTRVGGVAGLELIHELRAELPELPILYLANQGRSWAGVERQLPGDVPVLREPFTAEELRAVVHPLLTSGRKSRSRG
jgi:two-component system OmpR family response regulator